MNNCENEARCLPNDNTTEGYVCECVPGYVGEYCIDGELERPSRPHLTEVATKRKYLILSSSFFFFFFFFFHFLFLFSFSSFTIICRACLDNKPSI